MFNGPRLLLMTFLGYGHSFDAHLLCRTPPSIWMPGETFGTIIRPIGVAWFVVEVNMPFYNVNEFIVLSTFIDI